MTPPSFDYNAAHPGSILVVDDEPSVLAIAAAILNTADISPLKARNGEEAIEVLQREHDAGRRISIAILDLTMPGGLSGFETLEALRKIDPAIKVIACSGFFQEGALELCQSIGFSNILAKPYTPDSLLGLIRRVQHEAPPAPRPAPEPEPAAVSVPQESPALAAAATPGSGTGFEATTSEFEPAFDAPFPEEEED